MASSQSKGCKGGAHDEAQQRCVRCVRACVHYPIHPCIHHPWFSFHPSTDITDTDAHEAYYECRTAFIVDMVCLGIAITAVLASTLGILL